MRADPGSREPVDPDVDLHLPQQRVETAGHRLWQLLATVACGGALGALARHGVLLALPAGRDGLPWNVLAVNGVGCALIGVLMVLVSDLPPGGGRFQVAVRRPLVRPFLGVGVLGGFTTFSAYALGVVRLLDADRTGRALAYLAGTPTVALVAVALGVWPTRALVARMTRPGGEHL